MEQTLKSIISAPQIMFAKGTILRDQYPFSLDLSAYSRDDYSKIIPALKEIEARLLEVPASSDNLRWIHTDDTVYFYSQKFFDVPYEDFVNKVDICHIGEFYRDSISFDTRIIDTDDRGRPTHQAVRIVALPQPNYAAFMGKANLDVYKLEKIDYEEGEQRLWMLTVHSPNESARCDDGFTSFKRTPDGKTLVTFLACQNFPIPPLMALSQIDRWTWFKNLVTENAYRRFSKVMMNNLEDKYHGRNFYVGRTPTASKPANA